MATSDYPGRTVLIAFFFKNQEAGSAERRKKFSQELFDGFDDHIVEACAKTTPPIVPSPRVRATIAVMAENAPGSSDGVKARRAVQAYFEFRGF